jgi:hypothetical protein
MGSATLSSVRPVLLAVASGVALSSDPPEAWASSIREDGLVEINGEVLFPIGLFDSGIREYGDWNEQIRACGANVVWDFKYGYEDVFPRCREVADSARSAGYYLLIGSRDTIEWDNPETEELEVDVPIYEDWRLDNLKRCVAGTRELILGFTNRDEAVWTLQHGWLGDIDASHIFDTYQQIHEKFPRTFLAMNFEPVHLTGSLDAWRRDLLPFFGATDVVMHASYPYPAGRGTCSSVNVLGFPDCTMDRLAQNADLFLSEMNRPGQPLWVIIQVHKAIPRKEARWEAYASVVHGATGIFWAGWTWVHQLGSGFENWPVISPVIREVSELHDFLVGPDISGAFSEQVDVEIRAKKHLWANEIAVFAISRNGFRGRARIRLPRGESQVAVVGEDRALSVASGWIEDDFDGYEAHVYRYSARSWNVSSALAPSGPRAFALESGLGARLHLNLAQRTSMIAQVYDVAGRRIALAGTGTFEPGEVELHWNGRTLGGGLAPSGVYFVRVEASGHEPVTTKVVLRR